MTNRTPTPVLEVDHAVAETPDRSDTILAHRLGEISVFAPEHIAVHDVRIVAEPEDGAEDAAKKEELVRLLLAGLKA